MKCISKCFIIVSVSLLFQLQLLNASHQAELATLRKTSNGLQDSLESMTAESLQLKTSLMEITTERDGLKQHLRFHSQLKSSERLVCPSGLYSD